MEQAFRQKILPTQWFWCILNNLDKFNSKPELILELVKKFKKITPNIVWGNLKILIFMPLKC